MQDFGNHKDTHIKEDSRDLSVDDTERQPVSSKSPVYFLGIVAISIILIEELEMIFLPHDHSTSLLVMLITHTFQLIILISPILYLFLYRPMRQYINRQRQIETTLLASEEKYRILVNMSPVGIFHTDMGGMVTYINKEGLQIADLTLEDAYSTKERWAKRLHPEDRERVMSEWNQAVKDHTDFKSEYRFQRKDGKSSWVIAYATVLKDSAGQIMGYMGTLSDITDRKEAEEKLKWESSVNSSLADLSCMLLSEESMTIDEISCQVLELARRLTGSELGYVGYIDPDTDFMISPTLTRNIWAQCNVPNKSIIFEKFTGLWGWVLNNKKSLMTNTPADDPRLSGLPEGHVPIQRFLSVPALAGDKLVGQISLANPNRDYTTYDLKLLEQMADLYAIAIQHMWTEKAIRESEEKLRTITCSSSEAMVMIDHQGTISLWNDSAERIFGYKRDEAIGKDMHELIVPQRYHDAMKKGLEKFTETGEGEVLGKVLVLPAVRKGGEEFFAEHSLSAVRLKDKWHSIGIMRDVTERIRAEKELIEAATRERMTGLLNRFSFEKDEKTMKNPVLVLIDIDGFRHVNDLYGTEVGNSVLKDFARYLESIPPESLNAKVYKLGGDDFGILFEDDPAYHPMDLAKKIVEEGSNRDFMYEGKAISISLSTGISRERPLLEKADMVLNYLRKHTRVKFMEYNEALGLKKDISEKMKMLEILKKAINRNAVVSYFQPIVNNKNGQIEKYECLVRIIDEGGKVLSPFSFLQVAKEARLYGEITKRMIERGIMAFEDKDFEFSINISVEDIHDSEIESFLTKILKNNPVIAYRITFEIIESEGIENYDTVHAFIQKVKEYGCKIAIDDFGAGYSNFGHTMQLNIDYLKIDSSLIKEIDKNEKSQILTETIVSYAQKLGIKTIAEYVHSKEVHQKVIELGVDYSQGYYLGEPKPIVE